MALNTPFLAAILALTAATCWCSGDFVVGLAARRFGTFRSILVIFSVGMVALVIVAMIRAEPLSPLADLAWGALARLLGLVGLGFQPDASLDEGNMWASSFALMKLTAAEEAKIATLVKKAVS